LSFDKNKQWNAYDLYWMNEVTVRYEFRQTDAIQQMTHNYEEEKKTHKQRRKNGLNFI